MQTCALQVVLEFLLSGYEMLCSECGCGVVVSAVKVPSHGHVYCPNEACI